jgi:hypothetical protein
MQFAANKGWRYTVERVAFKVNATIDEIIETFVSSGFSDVVKIDPKEGRAKKLV